MTQNKTRCEGASHLVLVVGMGESRTQQEAFSGGLVAASSRRRLPALPLGYYTMASVLSFLKRG